MASASSDDSPLRGPPGKLPRTASSSSSSSSSLRRPEPKASSKSALSSESELRCPEGRHADSDDQEDNDGDGADLSRTWSQKGLVTTGTATRPDGAIAGAVDMFPLDPDKRFYWAMALRDSVGGKWDQQFAKGLKHPWQLDSGATGFGAEYWITGGVGIPTDHNAVGCDPCEAVRLLLMDNKHSVFGHLFEDFSAMIKREGRCFRCGTACRCAEAICTVKRTVFPDQRRDAIVIGPPCQPFSHLASSRNRGASNHPLFAVLFGSGCKVVGYEGDSVLDYLAVHLPHVVIIEEVVAFGEIDKADGCCWLREFLKRAKSLRCPWSGEFWYTSCNVWTESPGKWLDVKRPRRIETIATERFEAESPTGVVKAKKKG